MYVHMYVYTYYRSRCPHCSWTTEVEAGQFASDMIWTLSPTRFVMRWQTKGDGQRTKDRCIGKGARDDLESPNPVQVRPRE